MEQDIFSALVEASDLEMKERSEGVDLGLLTRLIQKQIMLEGPSDPRQVATLYKTVTENNVSVETIEELLKMRKKDLLRIRNTQIPETMTGFGLKEFMTEENLFLEVKDDVSVSVKNQEGFFQYLEESGYKDLIKEEFTIQNFSNREEVIDALDEIDCEFSQNRKIHSQTLKKFVKDRMGEGVELPNSISVFEYKYSKISVKKPKRRK